MMEYKLQNGIDADYYQMDTYSVWFNLLQFSPAHLHSRYTDTLLESDVDGNIYTNASSRKTGPQPDRGRRQLIIATSICAVFFVAELLGGMYSGSLAILTDAAHLLTDMSSFIISLVAIHLAERPPTKTLTYGWHRAEVLGALISVEAIWILTAILCYSAVQRIRTMDFEIHSSTMVGLSACAILVNIANSYFQVILSHGHSHSSESDTPLNVRAAIIHVIGDLLQSCGVLIASIVIYINPEYKIIDPICTFMFSIITLITTTSVVKDLVRFIMEGSPAGLNLEQVKKDISVDGVMKVHDLHAWALTPQQWVLTAHVVINTVHYNCEDVVKRAVASVKSEKRFLSITLQPEAHDPDQPVVADMWSCQLKSAWTNQV
ncbi:unnamed protein product [Oikopleura dioica]|uniref:Zinc transporter 8 n=1 Tax=Oikopleura dioica TaxID=34765 RepID=E4XJ10_OIKDI|nr:unnamed protein product [Oikopleura dioica]CBY31447.1 unnamed protein product [Oikopleura dioica]